MGVFAERMKTSRLRVTSADGDIAATMTGGNRVEVTFRHGAYRHYDDTELARQLRGLISNLFERRLTARLAALSEAFGRTMTSMDGDGPFDTRTAQFQRRRDALTATGRSPRGCVAVRNTGGTAWQVRLKPGTVEALDETDFVREFLGAVAATRRDQAAKTVAIKADVVGPAAYGALS